MEDQDTTLNIAEWYTPTQAAKRLTANSGKPVATSYVRTLARYGKVRSYKISNRSSLYFKVDIDSYIVEERGEKAGRVKRQKSVSDKKKNKRAA